MIITGVLLSEGRVCVRGFLSHVDVDPAPVQSASTIRIISTGFCPVVCEVCVCVCCGESSVIFMVVNTQLCVIVQTWSAPSEV